MPLPPCAPFTTRTVKQDGCTGSEAFEQVGRAGHWVIVEDLARSEGVRRTRRSVQQRLSRRHQGDSRERLRPAAVQDHRRRRRPPRRRRQRRVRDLARGTVAPNPAVAPMLAKLAQASRQEPGNLRFDVLQHTMRANHFTVIETWRDQAALDAHVTAAHTKQYRDEVLPLTGSPLDERVFKAAR
jgi:quinol monooxygenase YgiN